MTLPRVSTILNLFDGATPYYTDEHRDRGSYYHDLIEEGLRQQDLTYWDHEPFLHPLREFLDKELEEVLFVEHCFEHRSPQASYCGHPDSTLRLKSYGDCHPEFKTGKAVAPMNRMQQEAYSRMTSPVESLPCLLVILGGPKLKLIPYTHSPQRWACFLAGVKFWEAKEALKTL